MRRQAYCSEGFTLAGIGNARGDLAFPERVDVEHTLVHRNSALAPNQLHVKRSNFVLVRTAAYRAKRQRGLLQAKARAILGSVRGGRSL